MTPMLHCLPEKRATAESMLSHIWLYDKTNPETEKMYWWLLLRPTELHDKIKEERYRLDEPREEVWYYSSDREDGSV